ncbi:MULTISPECIES: hypothetical protein [unclassified Gemella]|uniref:hypothetical protein n=1 Tax=unclassified Gemella TaxID=2624949 RepID=UPI001C04C1A4|nr:MULTISPECIES: hypothetical protein [unclassified Gemella]MBU0279030.1 hypothetical protein [Gemella sp. zg-1178]QWQ39102.1 hypothetical protein KMP11_01855 [Gemella sp. zg-570]
MDMIVGLPGENIEDIKDTLNNFEKLAPENITVHALSFKRASQMTKQRSRYPVASGREAEQMLEITKEWMKKIITFLIIYTGKKIFWQIWKI